MVFVKKKNPWEAEIQKINKQEGRFLKKRALAFGEVGFLTNPKEQGATEDYVLPEQSEEIRWRVRGKRFRNRGWKKNLIKVLTPTLRHSLYYNHTEGGNDHDDST